MLCSEGERDRKDCTGVSFPLTQLHGRAMQNRIAMARPRAARRVYRRHKRENERDETHRFLLHPAYLSTSDGPGHASKSAPPVPSGWHETNLSFILPPTSTLKASNYANRTSKRRIMHKHCPWPRLEVESTHKYLYRSIRLAGFMTCWCSLTQHMNHMAHG